MKAVSVIGSGRSSVYLIEYLFDYCSSNAIPFKVYDINTQFIKQVARNVDETVFLNLDISDTSLLEKIVSDSQLVVSMLPAFMHPSVADLCLKHHVHLATASYVSDHLIAISEQVKSKGLKFLNEMGLDPGIDHMSAMKLMDELREKGAEITAFKSYCGGLVADEDDGDNPWKYKFSWNPRNVVLAAQGAPAQFLEKGKMKLMPYQQIFKNAVSLNVHNYGQLDAYPNRDSLKYLEVYRLQHVQTMIRGTFRKSGYAKAWQVFIELGLTDDALILSLPASTTFEQWLDMYLPAGQGTVKEKFAQYVNGENDIIQKFEWLGFFGQSGLPILHGTSAQILEEFLKSKWVLKETDHDLVVMLHQIEYKLDGVLKTHESSLVLKGESNTHTAMAKTVGLPLAIGCKLLLEGNIHQDGVLIPVDASIYLPILKELESYGIQFEDREY